MPVFAAGTVTSGTGGTVTMMWLGCIQSAGRLGRSLRRTAGVDGLGAAAQKTQTQGRDSGPDFKPSDAQQTGHRLVSG